MAKQNTGSTQGPEIVKVCILFEEKWFLGSNSKVCYYHCGAQDTDAVEGQYPMCQDCVISKLQPTLRMKNIQSTRAKMLKKWKKNTVYNSST